MAKPKKRKKQCKGYHRMEVARVPKRARRTVRIRLDKLGVYLEGALEPDEIQRVMSMIAGVLNRVSAGVRHEVADNVAARGEGLRRAAETDCDLHAAAELADLAVDLHLEAASVSDLGREESAADVAREFETCLGVPH